MDQSYTGWNHHPCYHLIHDPSFAVVWAVTLDLVVLAATAARNTDSAKLTATTADIVVAADSYYYWFHGNCYRHYTHNQQMLARTNGDVDFAVAIDLQNYYHYSRWWLCVNQDSMTMDQQLRMMVRKTNNHTSTTRTNRRNRTWLQLLLSIL